MFGFRVFRLPDGAEHKGRCTTPASGPSKALTVDKKLGEGGCGVVYHVWNISTGKQYAVKRPKEDSAMKLLGRPR